MKYLEHLLDSLIKQEGESLEINLSDPPFIYKDNKKHFLTKVPFTESEFNLIEFEFRDEFSGQAVFFYKDRYITTSRTSKARLFALETEFVESIDLPKLFQLMNSKRGTDLHLTPCCKPMMRIDGEIETVEEFPPVREDKLREEIAKIIPPERLSGYESGEELCFVQELAEKARFRVHVFHDRRGLSVVFRKIPLTYVNASELGVPTAFVGLCYQTKGLLLITGAQGSGKTTTLASLIDAINRNQKRHIMVLENPIEYLQWNKRSHISQKECATPVGVTLKDLQGVLTSDADVVALGEIRSPEVLHLAMEMAGSGHLVIGILPTLSVLGTIEHVIDQYHPIHKVHIRNMLAGCLLGILSQVLCRKSGGSGRIAAFEALSVTPATANIVREGKIFQLATLMQPGNPADNRLLNDVLIKMVETGVVDSTEALLRAYDPDSLRDKFKVKGIAGN